MAKGIRFSQVTEICVEDYKGDSNGDFLRILCEDGIMASGRTTFQIDGSIGDVAVFSSALASIEMLEIWSEFPVRGFKIEGIDMLSQSLAGTSSLQILALSDFG